MRFDGSLATSGGTPLPPIVYSAESKIIALASQDPALQALLTRSSFRMTAPFRMSDTQRIVGSDFPSVTLQMISDIKSYTFEGRNNLALYRIQFVIWGGPFAAGNQSASDVRDALIAFLDGFSGVQGGQKPTRVVFDERALFSRSDGPIWQRVLDALIYIDDSLPTAAATPEPLTMGTPIETKLITAASADAGMQAMFGGRIYDTRENPGSPFPALTLQTVPSPKRYTAEGRNNLAEYRVRFVIWGGQFTSGEAQSTSGTNALMSFLDTFSAVAGGQVATMILNDQRGLFPLTDGPIWQRIVDAHIYSDDSL